MSLRRTKEPRIPNYIEKLNKICDKIDDYKAGRNCTEIEEKEGGKPFKMPMFQVKLDSINRKTTRELPDKLSFYSIVFWIANRERIDQTIWLEYNRIYLDFSSESLIIRFKEKGKRSFDSYKQEFNFSNITIENELIRMENNKMVILIGWPTDIPYILIERKLDNQESEYILYRIFKVDDSDGIIDREILDDSDEENFIPIKKEKERTIRMREDTKPDKVNENEVIDLTITHRVPGIVDLTGDMDEVQPTKPSSPIRPVRPISPIGSNEPVANNTLYEGESDYASEEPEYNGIDFYERDDESRYNRSPVKSPVISRRTSPFSNRSPFNQSMSDIDLSYMSPTEEYNRQFVASPGRTQNRENETNFDISLLDTEDNESQIGHDDQLSSQSTSILSQLIRYLDQPEQSEQPTQSQQPEQTNQSSQPNQSMSESENENYSDNDFDTLF